VARLRGHGLALDLGPGWEGQISRRSPGRGETTHPVLHAATFALPPTRGDFGSGAVETMQPEDILVTLLEHHPDATGTPLFSASGPPFPLRPDSFSPTSLQRMLPGQSGMQAFFTWRGRALCLYVVLGSHFLRARLVRRVNDVLSTLAVDPPPVTP